MGGQQFFDNSTRLLFMNPVAVLNTQLYSNLHMPVRLDAVSTMSMSVPEQYFAINEMVMSNLLYFLTSFIK